MGSLSHVKADKVKMSKYLCQLANLQMRLVDAEGGHILIQNTTKSSFVTEGRLCVPTVGELRAKILSEAHYSRYAVHPGATKMYRDLRQIYWWNGMKKNIVEMVAQCPNCQQVKAEHQRPGGLTQYIKLPLWKRDLINMDFITGLPRTPWRYDYIWVIIDRLTKSAHFLPVKTTYSVEDYAKLYIREIVRLHGVPLSIISDRGAQFTAYFWKSFQKGLGTQVNLSTAFHPQTDGQAERTIQTVEDMLHSYADVRRRDLEFDVEDWVFLKVSPMKGVMRFGKKGKLSPRYVGPYKIIQRIGRVEYDLDLPSELETVHPMFHVSMLRKCIGDPSRITPMEDIHIDEDLSYAEVPVAILDRQVRKLQTKEVASVKVLWRNNNIEKMTWEAEEEMKKKKVLTTDNYRSKLYLLKVKVGTLIDPSARISGFSCELGPRERGGWLGLPFAKARALLGMRSITVAQSPAQALLRKRKSPHANAKVTDPRPSQTWTSYHEHAAQNPPAPIPSSRTRESLRVREEGN
uniref:Integrase catalytic domain-containing protein n=1 Tax=Nicotiana tabacum TaxID=4097 RepID=A0A1S3Z137_TOBAC|nr:PREDICTED: uncharacterized protein LOC107781627 [Nicotiana tabacum]